MMQQRTKANKPDDDSIRTEPTVAIKKPCQNRQGSSKNQRCLISAAYGQLRAVYHTIQSLPEKNHPGNRAAGIKKTGYGPDGAG
jgi:hypothetical protein